MAHRDHITTSEAAARADLSVRMLRHHVGKGRLTPVERIGNTMLFDPADVDRLARSVERRRRWCPSPADAA